jgi:uncharacterized protein YdhG (YjbR/CyaY superfamily)
MATDIDDYLAGVSEPNRSALENLRQTIRAIVPDATEVISYQIPTFRYQGRMLVGFAATQNGFTFHVMSTRVLSAHAADVKEYAKGKGSIRSTADKPLPHALVSQLVKARIAENEGRAHARRPGS